MNDKDIKPPHVLVCVYARKTPDDDLDIKRTTIKPDINTIRNMSAEERAVAKIIIKIKQPKARTKTMRWSFAEVYDTIFKDRTPEGDELKGILRNIGRTTAIYTIWDREREMKHIQTAF